MTTTREHRHWTLLLVCASTALLMVNVAAPQVALPAIMDSLHASFNDAQWVLSAYAFASAVLLLTAGSLADRFGRRRLFLTGLATFALASLLCATAPDVRWLVLARLLKGVGGALIFPSSLALLGEEYRDGPARRRAIAVWGGSISASFVLGPLIGGALVELIGWRAVFCLNLAIALPALALSHRHLRESRVPAPRAVDIVGVAVLTTGLAAVQLALLRGNALGWGSSAVLGCFSAGAMLLVAFVAIERKVPAPMVDLALFANRTFTGATVAVAVLGGATFGAFAYLSLFLMQAQGRGPIEAGLVIAPQSAVSLTVAFAVGRLNERVELRRALAGGLVLLAAGMASLRGFGPEDGWTYLLPGLVLVGVGVGLVNPLGTFAHLGVLPPADGGLAAAFNNTARQLGLAIGLAGLGAIVDAALRGTTSGTTYAGALDDLWAIGIGINLLAAVAVVRLVDQRDLVQA